MKHDRKKYEVNTNLTVIPKDYAIESGKRIITMVDVNSASSKKAVVIGINPSIACDNQSDTTLTKISRYLYQYDIGELAMINLFKTISTEQPGIDFSQESNLEKHHDLLVAADAIVVAWGIEDKYIETKQKAFTYLLQFGDKVYYIQDKKGITARTSLLGKKIKSCR